LGIYKNGNPEAGAIPTTAALLLGKADRAPTFPTAGYESLVHAGQSKSK
jgi:hypothetical protein